MRRLFCFLVLGQCQIFAADSNFVRSSSSKAHTSARLAVQQLNKNNPQATASAILSLEQLCNDASFRRLQIEERYEIFRALLTAYQKGKAYEKEEKLILQLLHDVAFRSYSISLKVSLVHSYLAQDRLLKAAELIQGLKATPERYVTFQDRQEIQVANSCFNTHSEQKLAQAESFYQKTDFAKATVLFECLFELSSNHHFPQTLSQKSLNTFLDALVCKLCLSYILQNEDEKARQLLQAHPLTTAEGYYLHGLIAKKETRYEEALRYFLQCQPPTNASLAEAATCALKLGRYRQARELIEATQDGSQKQCLACLLEIEEKNFAIAEMMLDQLEDESAFHYLKGYLFFSTKKPDFACVHLEQAIQLDNKWQQEARLLLGQTYLELSRKSYPEAEREVFFERAICCFTDLKTSKGFYRAIAKRAEGHAYFAHGKTQNLRELIQDLALDDPTRYELLLLLAERTGHYDEVTKSHYHNEPLFPKALFLSSSFEKAYQLIVQRENFKRDFFLVREIVEVLIKNKKPELALVLLLDFAPRLQSPDLQHECLYLITWALKSAPFQETTFSYFDQFLERYPKSPFVPDVLFFKGVTYWKNGDYQKAFALLDLALQFGRRSDELLFFLANTKEKLALDAKATYSELFTSYPDSAFAAESYFRYFPESAYLRQEIEAIAHLKKMPKSMHETLYGVLGSLYVASAHHQETPQKNSSDAQRRLLQESMLRFDLAINQANHIQTSLPEALQATLKRRLEYAKLERLQILFSSGNFLQVIHASDELKIECCHSDIWQEASFLKARALLLEGKEALSREELLNLLEYSKRRSCEAGEVLIRAMMELALYNCREEHFSEAEGLLSKAMMVHAKGASHELILELLIAKSHLHQKKGELDLAMMLLSSVINDESASSLRIQAMYLRAELYEQKGRRDLAFRQLQAAAKKGGEWGQRSRQKLGDKYGYE